MALWLFPLLCLCMVFAKRKDNLPCPGHEAGFKCNYKVKFSQRDNDHFFCDIDIISPHTSWSEFESKYYFKQPVVINTKLSDWARNASLWSKHSLRKRFGNHPFEVGNSLNGIYSGGVMDKQMTLKKYLKHLKNKKRDELYIFDRSLLGSLSFKEIYTHILKKESIPYFNGAHNKLKINYDKYKML